VILRVSSIAVPEAKLDRHLEHVQENELTSYHAAPGLTETLVRGGAALLALRYLFAYNTNSNLWAFMLVESL
jgi:hypothetical protein